MVLIMIQMHCQTYLVEMIGALGAVSGFTHILHGRQQQAHQYGNDRNHHEQFH
jgi:hypothetical protein